MIIIALIDNFSSDNAHTNVKYAVKISEGFIKLIFLNHLRRAKKVIFRKTRLKF